MSRAERLAVISSLLASFSIALYLRLYRVFEWGWWLDEFDPYIRYYLAEHTLRHGLAWWWSGGHFVEFWHPHGVDWSRVLLPGTSLYGLFVYALLSPLGVDLWRAVIIAPAVFGSMAVLSMFYLGYRVGSELGAPRGGETVGLVSAMLTAIAPAFIERGLGAWFDDEPVSLFLIPLGLALILEGLKRPWAGALAGAALGYVAWTWGAHFYVWNLLGLYAAALPGYYYLRRALSRAPAGGRRARAPGEPPLPFSARNFLASYLLFYLVYAAFVASVPRYGPHALTSAFNILPAFGLASAALTWLLEERPALRRALRLRLWVVVATAAAAAAVFAAAVAAGLIGGRFLAVLLPAARPALVASVAEHGASSFMQVAVRYGPLAPLIIAAVPGLLTPQGLLILTYLITAGYSAVSMVRLLVLMAPAAIAAAAVGIVRALGARRLGALVAAAAAVSAVFCLAMSIGVAKAPVQVTVSAVGTVSDDFLDALLWLKTRLPPLEPVASWWDYGYWITVIGNKSSLADNSTINATQIGVVATAFMSPPRVGSATFERLGARYVLAIMPYVVAPAQLRTGETAYILYHEQPPGGDFLKSYWMARIALENVKGAASVLGAGGASPEDFIYSRVMSYPGPPPRREYAYFMVGDYYYPVPLDLNRTLYAMLFSKVRFVPIYGSEAGRLSWIFEGVYAQGSYVTLRQMGVVGGNVYLPVDAPREAELLGAHVIRGWTPEGIDVVEDPLTGRAARIAPATAVPEFMRPVYVSRPHGWVVIYELSPP
jgi:dolichyl-diphosphooligosaccharide--protein glycosyltransferase